MTTKSLEVPLVRAATEAAPAREEEAPGRRPLLFVAGSDELVVRRVARRLDRLRVNVVTRSWEQLLETLPMDIAALVLVAPIRNVTGTTAVEIVRDHPYGKTVPIFVVAPDTTSSRAVRSLYKAGVSAVFHWPRESKILATLFAETFGILRVRGRAPRADKALTRTVRAHLRAGHSRGATGLRLFARDGRCDILP